MLLLLANLAFADDVSADLDAQVRPRVEADSVRGLPPGEGPVLYATLRTRVGVSLQRDAFTARAMASDVRTMGEEADTRRDYSADGLDLREGWVRFNTPRVYLSVGRFERGLYNERLLAIANWRQSGRSFDGAILEATLAEAWQLEARGYVLREGSPQVASSDQAQREGRDRAMGLVTLRYQREGALVAPMLFVDGDGELGRLRTTSGVYTAFTGSSWTVEAEGYVQAGREGDDALLAGMVGARADWRPGATSLGLGYELLSADADPSDGRRTTFNTLFGANHRYYGHIDIATFYVGAGVDDLGLQDVQLRASWTPRVDLTLGADLHTFVAALAVEDRLLAVEPDLYLRKQLATGLTLSAGANLWIAPDPDEREWMGWVMLDGKLKTRIAQEPASSP